MIKLSIAHVGHTNSQDDRMRTLRVLEWFEKNGFDATALRPDFIDINHGRDFLREERHYEAVVLHFIFRGGPRHHPMDPLPELRYSPCSSWANWRKRLVQTGARFIFAYGGVGEVSRAFLVNLDGYEAVLIDEELELWVFKRQN